MNLAWQFSKRFAFPLWKWYLAGIVALAATNLVTLEIPQLAKTIVNALQSGEPLHPLSNTALAIVGLGLLTILIRALSRILIFWPGRKLEATSKSYLFAHMMQLSDHFYQKFGMGELISRLANDIGQLRAFYAFGFLQLMNLIFLMTFTITKMISMHATLTLVALAPLCLMILFMGQMVNFMHKVSLENQQAVGRLTNKVTEAFVNVHVIKSNTAEITFLDRAETENEAVYQSNMKAIFLRTVLFPLLGALMNLSQVLVVFYGGYEVINGRLTTGDILAFNVYISYLAFPLSAVGIIVSLYQRCRAALERINAIETAEKDRAHPEAWARAKNDQAILAIEGFTYTYPGTDKPAIENFTLTVAERERIGIFGPIGSGKSTLLNAIARIIEPPAGTIFFSGQDVLRWDPRQLRGKLGYAQQQVHLFSNSVGANLAFGVEHCTQNDLQAAAAQAQVLNEIEQFDDGWQTEIGEKGLRLSGGQKQRLALARILLRRPKLFLLDDVLSAVDQKTERQLIDSMTATNAAMILATHRISALRRCHRIVLIDKGKIIDQGTFTELAQRHPVLQAEEDLEHE